jgi:hypothetical protein
MAIKKSFVTTDLQISVSTSSTLLHKVRVSLKKKLLGSHSIFRWIWIDIICNLSHFAGRLGELYLLSPSKAQSQTMHMYNVKGESMQEWG